MKVTAETITVVQLRWLRVNTGWLDYGALDQETIARAMRGDSDARELCAAAWNARHGDDK